MLRGVQINPWGPYITPNCSIGLPNGLFCGSLCSARQNLIKLPHHQELILSHVCCCMCTRSQMWGFQVLSPGTPGPCPLA